MTEPVKANAKKEYAALVLMIRHPENINIGNLLPGHFQIPQARQVYNILREIKKRADKNHVVGAGTYDFSGANIKAVAKEAKLPLDSDTVDMILDNVDDFVEYNDNAFDGYCNSLRNAGVVSMLLGITDNIKEKALRFDLEEDAKELVREAEAEILQLENQIVQINDPVKAFAEDLIEADLKEYEEIAKDGKSPGIHTGFKCMDDGMLLRPGSLTVLGARTKVGKSAFALNVALNVAKHYGLECPVLWIDTEMSGRDQRSRALSVMSNVAEQKILKNELTGEEQRRVKDAIRNLDRMPIYHLYTPSFSAEGVLALTRRMYHSHGIRLLIFDYIKLPDDTDLRSAQEYQFLGYFTSMLKNKIAGALNIPVLTFAQLNREGIKQAESGEVNEGSIGGSDRIIMYCSTYGVLRRANEKELKDPSNPGAEYGNRKLHILLGRNGGESTEPITITYRVKDGIPEMKEVGEWLKRDAQAKQTGTTKAGKLADAGPAHDFGGDESNEER
mgnify:CR=1 FL=1